MNSLVFSNYGGKTQCLLTHRLVMLDVHYQRLGEHLTYDSEVLWRPLDGQNTIIAVLSHICGHNVVADLMYFEKNLHSSDYKQPKPLKMKYFTL